MIMRNHKWHLIALILLYALLAVEYVRFVYGNYSSQGFEFQPRYSTIILGVVFVALAVMRLYVYKPPSDFSYAVSVLVAVVFVLPSVVMYQFGGTTIWMPVYALLFMYLLSSSLLSLPAMRVDAVSNKVQQWLLPVAALVVLLPFVAAYGFSIDWSVFSLGSNIYDVRALAGARGNTLTAYLAGPLCRVLLPVMIVYGLKERKHPLWAAGIVMMLYIFAVNPQKSVLLSVFVVLAFYFFDNYSAKSGLLLYALLGVVAVSALLNLVTGNLMVESIAVRRMFFIPVQVADNYFSFFQNAPIKLSHSVLSGIHQYPYFLEPANLIGFMMYNRTITHCNTGIIADGFMNFGHIGALFFVVVAAMIVRFLESLRLHYAWFGVVLLFVFTMLNGALFTTMLTHGGWALILAAIFLIPKNEKLF